MKRISVVMLMLVIGIFAGCSSTKEDSQEAQRQMLSARDLEEDIDALPKAIARYGEISQKFSGTPTAEKASQRKAKLEQAQIYLKNPKEFSTDSLAVKYEAVLAIVPDYLAVLKRLSTIYENQMHLAAPAAAMTGIIEMKQGVLDVWNKQVTIWSAYTFRPIPADRLWQDKLCKQAINVTQMLINERYRDYEDGLKVIHQGLAFAAGEDVKAQANVFAAYCTFWQGKKGDFEKGIVYAAKALEYEFLPDADRARAYHVTGLCYAYLFQDSHDLTELDSAIKALNECLNIDGDMTQARDLLKGLRIQRDRVTNAS